MLSAKNDILKPSNFGRERNDAFSRRHPLFLNTSLENGNIVKYGGMINHGIILRLITRAILLFCEINDGHYEVTKFDLNAVEIQCHNESALTILPMASDI